MIALNSRLAQEIVTRTMQIIPFNVNVMDARGIIIGSGDPDRIGKQHAGAQLVIAQQRTVEIDIESVHYLSGARPGVNLPLKVHDQICGVVGLTGEPDSVRQFGELVRMTAEMILERDQLNRDLKRDAGYQEEFVLQWIKGNPDNAAKLSHWATRLNVDMATPRVAMIATLDPSISPTTAHSISQHCQLRLSATHPDYLTATATAHELVILVPVPNSNPDAAHQRQQSLETWLKSECRCDFRLAMGAIFRGLDGIAHSYQCAQGTLKAAASRNMQKTCLSYYTFRLPVLLSTLGDCWQVDQLRETLLKLNLTDTRNATLLHTLHTWAAANGLRTEAAKKLNIHRNTLDYRLRQIEALTGLSFDKLDESFFLYASLQLDSTNRDESF